MRNKVSPLRAFTVYGVPYVHRSSLLGQLMDSEDEALSPRQLEAIAMVMSMASSKAGKVSVLGTALIGALPGPVKAVIENWDSAGNSEFPSLASWVSIKCIHTTKLVSDCHCSFLIVAFTV